MNGAQHLKRAMRTIRMKSTIYNGVLLKKEVNIFNLLKKTFMINYRVQNIEGLVEKFKQNGVEVVDEIATYEYGKFVHIMDPEGNKIELWEPIDDGLSGGETTK